MNATPQDPTAGVTAEATPSEAASGPPYTIEMIDLDAGEISAVDGNGNPVPLHEALAAQQAGWRAFCKKNKAALAAFDAAKDDRRFPRDLTVGDFVRADRRGALPQFCRRYTAPQGTRPRTARPRARGAGRPAVKGSSRRSSARSGDSDLAGDDPDPAPRLCACGCGASLEGRRSNARYHDGACRLRAMRARKLESAGPPPSRIKRCESCGCWLSRYGRGGFRCFSCAGLQNNGDVRELARCGTYLDVTVYIVLRRIGNWPGSVRPELAVAA
jgi:hypothetical protein